MYSQNKFADAMFLRKNGRR